MDKVQYRKFLMAKIDVAQREVEVMKDLVSMLDAEETTPVETSAPVKQEQKEELKKAKAPKKKSEPQPEKEVESETEAQETEAVADEDDFMNDEATDIDAPTLDDVRKVVKAFAAKHGKQKTEKLLSKFGAAAIPQIKAKDFAKVIELANKYL